MSSKMKGSEALDGRDDTPPPTYDSTIGSQTYDVHYREWGSHIIITNSTGQEMFVSRVGSSSTSLEIADAANQIIGNTKRSNVSSKIEVEMSSAATGNRAFEIHNTASVFGGSPKYTTPSFGTEVVWRNKAMSKKIIYTLIDGRRLGVANFESDPKTKIGKLQLADGITGEQLNEIAVTLLTLLHRKLKNIQTSNIVALT